MAVVDVELGADTHSRRPSIARLFEHLVASHMERRRRRRQIAELRSLPPGVLKDLGVDCSEIASIVHGAGRDTTRIKR